MAITRSTNRFRAGAALAALVLAFLVLVPFAQGSTNIIDMLTDMELGTSGNLVTSNAMSQSSHTNGSYGTWYAAGGDGLGAYPNALSMLFFTNFNNMAQRADVIVNGTHYTGSGNTISFMCDNNQIKSNQVAFFKFATPPTKVSAGFGFIWTGGSTFNLADVAAMENGPGEYFTVSVIDNPTTQIGIETFNCVSGANYANFTPGVKYWVTMLWDGSANAIARLRVYDTTTWLIVEEGSCTINQHTCLTFFIGRYDAHNLGAGGPAYYDNVMLDSSGTWPLLPTGATINAATTSWADTSNAIYSASNLGDPITRDKIQLPSSSNQWVGEIKVTNDVHIAGTGTNSNQSVIRLNVTGGSQNTAFRLSAPFIRMSDMQVRGNPGTQTDGWLIHPESNWCTLTNMYLQDALSAVTSDAFGVMYNCTVRNCNRFFRSFGLGSGQGNWDNYTPFSNPTQLMSTNAWGAEDCVFQIDKDTGNPGGTQVIVSSQQGALWFVRHCYFDITNFNYSPMFDSHGETDPGPLRGNIYVQVWSNYFQMRLNTTADKFIDVRGGGAAAYSNVVNGISTGTGVYMRKKDDETANFLNDPVTNGWFFANTEGASGTTPMPVTIEANDGGAFGPIQYYTHFQTNQNSGIGFNPIYQIPYPHPLTGKPQTGGGISGIRNSIAESKLGRANAQGHTP